uniref:Isoleucine--tRNA ligase n=1 Tax=Candidatus Aschnera chinzeii TaxID=1485666 RepID=A0AAT9G599_9ENTR|nr:MAG: isoleucine--tRNA ligase [Candidatus Aschnera chinzeii]
MHNYKNTLNLPQTTFSMRANLTDQEPKILQHWYKDNLYIAIRKSKIGKPIFILHDGPPYANGNIHIGHAINKILKDIIIKSKGLEGYDAPYIPGWDCHGLPIEHKIEQILKKTNNTHSVTEFRKICRIYAKEQAEKQKKDFIRMGVVGDWQNPYLTMNYKMQANTIRTLGKLIEKGYLIKGDKPVHWCTQCCSSLAEAEIEYLLHKADSIYVRFKAIDSLHIYKMFNINTSISLPIYAIIWTTTPWSLPANRAIAINNNYTYQLIEINSAECYIIAKSLVKNLLDHLKIKKWKILSECKSSKLEFTLFKHPFINFNVPMILSNHVILNIGTGLVHIAPAHGPEDYHISKIYKLNVYNPIGPDGCYLQDTHYELNGKFALHANNIIIKILRYHKALVHQEILQHKYPCCWRHKNPIIFRSTKQWFIGIEKNKLRNQLLDNITQVKWIPKYGFNHMKSMIINRPDWCISRQRLWGTPMPLFIHKKTNKLHPSTLLLIEQIAQYVEEHGEESWWTLDINKFLGEEANNYIKINDILDVWFDSGSTYFTVIQQETNFKGHQVDLYLEGLDQHRGWFMSSLIISTAIHKKSPYKAVMTHGFAVDKNGHKMSKSANNSISPQNIIDKFGADILRLWVASSDYSNDITISDDILIQTVDNYRRIRNTIRFLLANLHDFIPNKDEIHINKMIAIDIWAINCTNKTQIKIKSQYKNYNFHGVIQLLMHFCTIQMGSFYLDIIKDRLYTSKKHSIAHRSCQTAFYHILESLVRWISPILSFTADEIWHKIPGTRSQYIFTEEYYSNLSKIMSHASPFNIEWNILINIKNNINKILETAKKEKIIKNSLEAKIIFYADTKINIILNSLNNELHYLLLVSAVNIYNIQDAPHNAYNTDINGLKIIFKKANGKKCPRCWHYTNDIGTNKQYPDLCFRCINNVIGNGMIRKFI